MRRRLNEVVEQSYQMNHASGTAKRLGTDIHRDAICGEVRLEGTPISISANVNPSRT